VVIPSRLAGGRTIPVMGLCVQAEKNEWNIHTQFWSKPALSRIEMNWYLIP
jgi:hypothetical protein